MWRRPRLLLQATIEALRDLTHEQRLELLRGMSEGKTLRLVDADNAKSPPPFPEHGR